MEKLAQLIEEIKNLGINNIKKIIIEYFNDNEHKLKFNKGDCTIQRLTELEDFLEDIAWIQVEEIEIKLYDGEEIEMKFPECPIGPKV